MNLNKTTTTASVLFLSILMIGLGAVGNANAQFIANTTSGAIKTTNYNIYQNPGLALSIKYLKKMTVSETKCVSIFRLPKLIPTAERSKISTTLLLTV